MRKNQTECRLFAKITIEINVAPKLESRYTILSYSCYGNGCYGLFPPPPPLLLLLSILVHGGGDIFL